MAKGGQKTELQLLVAANVRRLRDALELSQEALADGAGLHRTFIGAVERAETNVSLKNVEKIAKALGVEAFLLLKP